MYLADSGTGRVDAFDFDATSGDLSRRRTIVTIDEPGVAPDGLTVDDDGGIWVALWGGGAVRRYATRRGAAGRACRCPSTGRRRARSAGRTARRCT